MRLKSIELAGFKSFAKKTSLEFGSAITAIVGPNGSGKSNIAESFRFVLGEQSMKSMRTRRGEDLIWNGSSASPRAGRASARLVFDNPPVGGRRALNLDFDEVSLERVVYRDGANDYLLNGSPVRLRDITELLSQANIGASGHHIISQGEADRVLSCSSRERREMLEDALGLTAYLYKREEAERKLEKTAVNMREVEALRRELAPHLKFLAGQVKKIEDAEKLRGELEQIYLEYLKRERAYLDASAAHLALERSAPLREHKELDAKIERLRAGLDTGKKDEGTAELLELEEQERAVRMHSERAGRDLGRIEGELAASERLAAVVKETIPVHEARNFAERILQEKDISSIFALVRDFLQKISSAINTDNHENLLEKKKKCETDLHALAEEEKKVAHAVEHLRKKIESGKDASRDAQRDLFAAMARRSELEAILASLRSREDALAQGEANFKFELGEAGALIGRRAAEYDEYELGGDESREEQAGRRKKLERIKIRLEESGMGEARDVLKEHQETTERDSFLANELEDLASSAEKLHMLIEELTATLETRFMDGVEKINTEFEKFFKLMFGGGEARLAIVKEQKFRKGSTLESDELRSNLDDEDTDVEEGIEITISLPHKRVKGLHMLSGGERALTSIALIFAMSQVNPPPFLILDETDAALDEANSRRYGDMIESLARKSQLILITHNRETMSRAGVLYGVTMGADGASKLLSVKFEDALAVAK